MFEVYCWKRIPTPVSILTQHFPQFLVHIARDWANHLYSSCVIAGRWAQELPVNDDASHVMLYEEMFGTRNEFGPSAFKRHHFKTEVR